MDWKKVEEVVNKYVPDVATFFPKDSEHRPNIEHVDYVVNALFGEERDLVVTGNEEAGMDCYEAALELILWVERFKL